MLLAMTFPLGTRVYTMLTIAVPAARRASGACFGLALRPDGAAIGAAVAGLGAGLGMFFHRRRALASFQTVTVDGCAEGIADVVLMTIAVYETAVFAHPGSER